MKHYRFVETADPSDGEWVEEIHHPRKKKDVATAFNATSNAPEFHGHLHPTTVVQEKTEGKSMGDIAGLLALMQGNKNMDLPGMLALCKENGYDGNRFGGEGMFMFVFLILFLFAGGGWNGLGRNNQQAVEQMATANGFDCQRIIGIHDRISAAQAASVQGFQQLDTNLCSSIATVLASVRDQGDRMYDATRNVGDTVRDCCCKLEAQLATINCEINGLGRDIRENAGLINAKIELEALKQENARAAMETRLSQQQKDCCCDINARFDRLECTLSTNRLQDENARLARELAAVQDTLRGNRIADAAVQQIQQFQLAHYTPTRTAAAAA